MEALARHLEQCDSCAQTFHGLKGEDALAEMVRRAGAAGAAPEGVVRPLMDRLRQLYDPGAATGTEEATWPPGGAAGEEESYSFLAPPQAPDERGRLGGYRVLEVLGSGGMGVVFLAEDTRLKRRVALKVIRPELVRRPELRDRFLREAQAAARVEHDNIVTVLHVEEAGGVAFLAMPLLRGESLEERLRRADGPLPIDEALRVGREVAAGLAAAHQRDLVHRDVKPANIFLTAGEDGSSGRVKILDFGLARLLSSEDAALSVHGQILGTPAYMAPEQGRAQAVDHRADLFSLGCVLYRMATGRPPFQGPDSLSVLIAVATDDPPPPRDLNPEVPPALAELIVRLLAKEREQRPESAQAVVDAISAIERERAEARRPRSPRPRLLLAAGAALLAAAVLVVWLSRGHGPAPAPPPPDPADVTFDFDEPGVGLAVRRGDEEEVVIDPRAAPTRALAPGTYRVRPTVVREGRELVPDEFIVKAGEAKTVPLRLVGQVTAVGGFDSAVTGVAASPRRDGRFLASSLDPNAALAVWAGASDSFRAPGGSLPPMACVAFAPDGTHAATGCAKGRPADMRIHLWDVGEATPKVVHHLEGHDVSVTAIAYAPDGKRLISGDAGGAVFVWDLENRRRLHVLKGHDDYVHGVAFSSDGKRALSGGSDQAAILWDVDKGEKLRALPAHPGKVLAVAFGPDPNEAATACDDGVIRIWNLKTDKCRELKGHAGAVRALAFSHDGLRLLSGGEDGTVRLWDAEGKEVRRFKPGEARVNGAAFTKDGLRAVSGGADRKVRLWELPR